MCIIGFFLFVEFVVSLIDHFQCLVNLNLIKEYLIDIHEILLNNLLGYKQMFGKSFDLLACEQIEYRFRLQPTPVKLYKLKMINIALPPPQQNPA